MVRPKEVGVSQTIEKMLLAQSLVLRGPPRSDPKLLAILSK